MDKTVFCLISEPITLFILSNLRVILEPLILLGYISTSFELTLPLQISSINLTALLRA